jgi:hypothetical protein
MSSVESCPTCPPAVWAKTNGSPAKGALDAFGHLAVALGANVCLGWPIPNAVSACLDPLH